MKTVKGMVTVGWTKGGLDDRSDDGWERGGGLRGMGIYGAVNGCVVESALEKERWIWRGAVPVGQPAAPNCKFFGRLVNGKWTPMLPAGGSRDCAC